MSDAPRHAHLIVGSEVDFASNALDLVHFALLEVRQLLDLCELDNTFFVGRSRNCDNLLCAAPEQKDSCLVDIATSYRLEAVRDALKDRFEGSTGLMTEKRGERAIGLGEDAVLLLQIEDRLDVRQYVRVVLNLLDHRLVLGMFEELSQVFLVKVGYAKRRRELAFVLHVLQDLPERYDLACLRDKRVVNEQEIRVKAQALNCRVDRSAHGGNRNRRVGRVLREPSQRLSHALCDQYILTPFS